MEVEILIVQMYVINVLEITLIFKLVLYVKI